MQLKILEDRNLHIIVFDVISYPVVTEACLLRECELCGEKILTFFEYNGEEETHYDQWITKNEKSCNRVIQIIFPKK